MQVHHFPKSFVRATILNIVKGITKIGKPYLYNGKYVSDTIDEETGEVITIETETKLPKKQLEILVLAKLKSILSSTVEVKEGDKVTFNNDLISQFQAQTSSEEMAEWSNKVLANKDKIGVVKWQGLSVTSVLYEGSKETIGIPTQYLVKLP